MKKKKNSTLGLVSTEEELNFEFKIENDKKEVCVVVEDDEIA
jgi:hypothetical protein